jgi:hypothetical protein
MVELDGVERRVIGVMPEGFLLSDEDLYYRNKGYRRVGSVFEV